MVERDRTIEDRIAQALAAVDVSQADMLRRLGVGKNAFTEWRKTDRKMPATFVEAFVAECARLGHYIDGHWLLTGEGTMRRTPKTTKETAFDDIASLVDKVRAAERDAAVESAIETRAVVDAAPPLPEATPAPLDPTATTNDESRSRRVLRGSRGKRRAAGGE